MSNEEFEEKYIRPLFATIAVLKDYSVIDIQKELRNRELERNATEIKENNK